MTKTTKKSPTGQSYGELLKAYKFFNNELFDGKLPDCLITLHRHRTALGYFWGSRYTTKCGKQLTDEIALNPDHLRSRTDKQSLSTLVHEMVHLWQHHFGKHSRNGYHNKEWGTQMEAIGLVPSSTAMPGGKKTGQKVSHYIVEGGPFDQACDALLKTGLAITWGSAPQPPKETKSGKRTKYTCRDCDAAAWGKEGLNIRCEDCDTRMWPQGDEGDDD